MSNTGHLYKFTRFISCLSNIRKYEPNAAIHKKEPQEVVLIKVYFFPAKIFTDISIISPRDSPAPIPSF